MENDKPVATYQERAAVMTGKALVALYKRTNSRHESAEEKVKSASKLQIEALNLLRLNGIDYQIASGKEQAHFDFWKKSQGKIHESFNFRMMQLCIKLANNFPNPIETLDESRAARQMMFEAFGEAESPKRLEAQVAHVKNPWNEIVNGFKCLFSTVSKVTEAKPVRSWSSDERSTFERNIKLLLPIYEEIISLRNAGSSGENDHTVDRWNIA